MGNKENIRNKIWNRLKENDVARFPFPVEGRIPNFEGADRAADRIMSLDLFKESSRVKVNPDSPQRPIRTEVLKQEKTLLVPSPRLRSGFYQLQREELSGADPSDATTIKGMKKFGTSVTPRDIDSPDLIVCGSVAVHRDGGRIGKGEGYSDLEYAILRETGHDDIPVVTTVHSLQVVEHFETDPHDVPLDVIATPDEVINTNTELSGPDGIRWEQISREQLEEMPILKTLRKRE